tara:strand:+ start:300 stop:521 length:222 start_codon:yes stop_codon:yes gene_type:complete
MSKDEIVQKVYDDTMDFMYSKDDWSKFKTEGSTIAYGILRAVFQTIFLLAPTKKSAVELIMMAIEEHLDGEVE